MKNEQVNEGLAQLWMQVWNSDLVQISPVAGVLSVAGTVDQDGNFH